MITQFSLQLWTVLFLRSWPQPSCPQAQLNGHAQPILLLSSAFQTSHLPALSSVLSWLVIVYEAVTWLNLNRKVTAPSPYATRCKCSCLALILIRSDFDSGYRSIIFVPGLTLCHLFGDRAIPTACRAICISMRTNHSPRGGRLAFLRQSLIPLTISKAFISIFRTAKTVTATQFGAFHDVRPDLLV